MKTTKIITCTLFVASVYTAQAFAHTTFVDGSAEQETRLRVRLQNATEAVQDDDRLERVVEDRAEETLVGVERRWAK